MLGTDANIDSQNCLMSVSMVSVPKHVPPWNLWGVPNTGASVNRFESSRH